MKVILLEDVRKVGRKDDVVDVSDGYARNFLIKNGKAVAFTKGSSKVLDKQLADKAAFEAEKKKEAEELAKKLETMKFEFQLKTGKEGQTFGSISTKQIAEALYEQGIKVEKRKITLDEPITSLGTSIAHVDLYRGQVIGRVNVHVSSKE